LKVDALRVKLGPISFVCSMKCNDLMSEYIISRSDGGRNCDCPCVVTGNKVITGPFTWRRRTIDKSSFINLEEFESHLVGLFAITVAFGHVIEDRAMMRLGPFVPL
jgi:hypothetical protein